MGQALAHCPECGLWLLPAEGCLHMPPVHNDPARPYDPVARATRHRGALPPGSAPVALSSNPNHASPFAALQPIHNSAARLPDGDERTAPLAVTFHPNDCS